MRNLLFYITLLISTISFSQTSQTIEIEGVTFPFSDIIEWKGMGTLLLSSDPSGVEKQINITLIADQPTSVWDQKFTPKNEEHYFISSENARFVYFLDNLDLDNGKVYFSQLSSAGNVKSTSVNLGTSIKKIGNYDYNDLELINVIVTDKALVHHFRYNDKKNKSIVEIATFITHHNFLSYAVELGSVSYDNLKSDKYGHWEYVGFTNDQIFFAARDYQAKNSGWTVKEFSSKGKEKTGFFISSPENIIAIENIGFGTTGSYYKENDPTIEMGLLTQINGQFYLTAGQRFGDHGAQITLFKLKENEWVELNNMKLNYFIEKKNLKLGIYPMNEGIGYHLNHNGYDKVSMIYFQEGKEAPHNDFTERTIYNPSSVFERKKKEEFNVILSEGFLRFDTSQLGKAGSVTFEYIK